MNNCKLFIIRALLILLVACFLSVIMMGLISCGPKKLPPQVTPSLRSTPISLSFSTISQGAPLGDHPGDPLFTVVIDASEWGELAGRLPPHAVSAGKQASITSDDILIVVFAGVKNSSGYGIKIESINFEEGEIIIHVTETIPGSGEITEPATTLPYHLVSLAREDLPRQGMFLFLFIDEEGGLLNQMEVRLP